MSYYFPSVTLTDIPRFPLTNAYKRPSCTTPPPKTSISRNSVRLCLEKNKTVLYSREQVISRVTIRGKNPGNDGNFSYYILSFSDFPGKESGVASLEEGLAVEDMRVVGTEVRGLVTLRVAEWVANDEQTPTLNVEASLNQWSTHISVTASRVGADPSRDVGWDLYEFAFPCGQGSPIGDTVEAAIDKARKNATLLDFLSTSNARRWKTPVYFRVTVGALKMEWTVQLHIAHVYAEKDAAQQHLSDLADQAGPENNLILERSGTPPSGTPPMPSSPAASSPTTAARRSSYTRPRHFFNDIPGAMSSLPYYSRPSYDPSY